MLILFIAYIPFGKIPTLQFISDTQSRVIATLLASPFQNAADFLREIFQAERFLDEAVAAPV